MKKGMLVAIFVAPMMFVALPLWGAPFDSAIGCTTLEKLGNANERAVEKWLEGLLGLNYDDSTVNLIYRNEYYFSSVEGTSSEYKSLNGWDPELSKPWSYAVVKYGTNFTAYRDGGDGLLTTEQLSRGISNVTFFGNGVQVPEPTTMILLGMGLVGLGVLSRRKS